MPNLHVRLYLGKDILRSLLCILSNDGFNNPAKTFKKVRFFWISLNLSVFTKTGKNPTD